MFGEAIVQTRRIDGDSQPTVRAIHNNKICLLGENPFSTRQKSTIVVVVLWKYHVHAKRGRWGCGKYSTMPRETQECLLAWSLPVEDQTHLYSIPPGVVHVFSCLKHLDWPAGAWRLRSCERGGGASLRTLSGSNDALYQGQACPFRRSPVACVVPVRISFFLFYILRFHLVLLSLVFFSSLFRLRNGAILLYLWAFCCIFPVACRHRSLYVSR